MSKTRSPIRSVVAFAIGCVTSPCCTPLYVPLVLVVFAGTPLAAWIGQNVGWVYAGLTLMSLASFVLALRWFNGRKQSTAEQRGATLARAQTHEPAGKHDAIMNERKGS